MYGYIKLRYISNTKAIEENNFAMKTKYQITDSTRMNHEVRTRDIIIDNSTKEKESVNLDGERKDYPEITPTTISDYICKMCGKSFQTREDLVHHQNFEKGKSLVLD